MNKILIWIGIVALSLQDYFKKQPVKPTRQQQFIQTGGTSQAFIEGVDEPYIITVLGKIFNKKKVKLPNKIINALGLPAPFWGGADTWEISGGVKNGGFLILIAGSFYMMVRTSINNGEAVWNVRNCNKDILCKKYFGSNNFKTIGKFGIPFLEIWEYIWTKSFDKDEIKEEIDKIEEIAWSGDYELAIILASSIKGIKKVLA